MRSPEIPADRKMLELLIARTTAHCRCFANTQKNLVYADEALARIDEVFVIIEEIIPPESEREWLLGKLQTIRDTFKMYHPIVLKIDPLLKKTFETYRLLAQQKNGE